VEHGALQKSAEYVRATQMPTYEFECDNEHCESNARIEQWMSINEPHDLECPFCHSSMHKVYSSVGVSFKGSGFYSTDNR
jgi:putative FmdB family regulatory protein